MGVTEIPRMNVTILSALCLSSLLLLSQGAPAPIFDPVLAAITGSFATPLALSGGLVAAEGLTLGATIPTWLLALKAGLFGKSILLGAGATGAGVGAAAGAAATRAALISARQNNNLHRRYQYN